MLRGAHDALGGWASAILVTKDGHDAGDDLERVARHFAAHPTPDTRSAEAAAAVVAFLQTRPPGERGQDQFSASISDS